MKVERDWHNVLEYAKDEGRHKMIVQSAQTCKDMGLSLDEATRILHLTKDEREFIKTRIYNAS